MSDSFGPTAATVPTSASRYATLARQAARRGAVVLPLDPPIVRQIGLVHRPGPLAPAARAFLTLAVRQP